jgi:hypothetical protein
LVHWLLLPNVLGMARIVRRKNDEVRELIDVAEAVLRACCRAATAEREI